jgi:hypothetical protein
MNYIATSNQHHALAPLSLEKEPLVATVQEVGQTTEPGWMFWGGGISSTCLDFNPRSYPGHYDYAIPATPPQEHVTGGKYVI